MTATITSPTIVARIESQDGMLKEADAAAVVPQVSPDRAKAPARKSPLIMIRTVPTTRYAACKLVPFD